MTSEPEPLTPVVYDAAYWLGWVMARAGQLTVTRRSIDYALCEGMAAYCKQAKAERIERIQAGE